MPNTQKLIINGVEITDIKDIKVESKENFMHSIINLDGTEVELYVTEKEAKIFQECLEKYKAYKDVYFGIKRIIPEDYCMYSKMLDFCHIRLGDETIRAYMTRDNFRKFGEKITEVKDNA